MATKKQLSWIPVLTALAGGIIAYNKLKEEDNHDDQEKILAVLKGMGLGWLAGYGFVWLVSEPNDTVNYSCYHNGRRVYEGICYQDRKDLRILEHLADGKRITDVKFDRPKPRSHARLIERTRIKKFQPKYNIQHNCTSSTSY